MSVPSHVLTSQVRVSDALVRSRLTGSVPASHGRVGQDLETTCDDTGEQVRRDSSEDRVRNTEPPPASRRRQGQKSA